MSTKEKTGSAGRTAGVLFILLALAAVAVLGVYIYRQLQPPKAPETAIGYVASETASAPVYALAGRLRETGRLERFQSAPGYAEIAGTGDCAREFALVRCGLALLARQYPDRVEVGS